MHRSPRPRIALRVGRATTRPPRNTAVTTAMTVVRTAKPTSGFRNAKTIAAIAKRPAPATASTDCTLTCEVSTGAGASARSAAAGPADATGAAGASDAADTADAADPADAAAATEAGAGAVEATFTGADGNSSISRCRSSIASAARRDASHTNVPGVPRRSAAHDGQTHEPFSSASHRGHSVVASRYRAACSFQAVTIGAVYSSGDRRPRLSPRDVARRRWFRRDRGRVPRPLRIARRSQRDPNGQRPGSHAALMTSVARTCCDGSVDTPRHPPATTRTTHHESRA